MTELRPLAFSAYVADAHARAALVVQPRMGFGTLDRMREGLRATVAADAATVGTLTLDSYTRVGDHVAAGRALALGDELNGFPLVVHGAADTKALVAAAVVGRVPVQVRHGSAQPLAIFRTLLDAGLDATEGGPVSYCLPYSRLPLAQAVEAWAESCETLAPGPDPGRPGHLESFAGCMLGQLCPPSLLVALGILEGLFFRQHKLRSISLSYAQQIHPGQDCEAIQALRRLSDELLPGLDVHIVVYTFMGLFPATAAGAAAISRDSVELAVSSGAQRLIVKTSAESQRIPTVVENVQALELAARHAGRVAGRAVRSGDEGSESETYLEARALIDAVIGLHSDIGSALVSAFRTGLLDLPYCLHPDNAGRTRTAITPAGRLAWADTGRMPLPPRRELQPGGAGRLLEMLSHNRRRYDDPARHQVAEQLKGSEAWTLNRRN